MSQEKANLARIRDNQRRSRARRKEYLQELEARLRQIDVKCMEASSEIQLAARRVADQNGKLRELLMQHGVGDDSIEAYLQSNPINGPDTKNEGQFNAASSHGTIQVPEQHTGASTAIDDGSQDSSVASHQFMTPSSTASRTSRVGHHHSTGRSVQQPQSMSSVAVPRNYSPSFNHSSHTPQNFDFDAQLSLLHPSSYQCSNN